MYVYVLRVLSSLETFGCPLLVFSCLWLVNSYMKDVSKWQQAQLIEVHPGRDKVVRNCSFVQPIVDPVPGQRLLIAVLPIHQRPSIASSSHPSTHGRMATYWVLLTLIPAPLPEHAACIKENYERMPLYSDAILKNISLFTYDLTKYNFDIYDRFRRKLTEITNL